LKRITHIVAAAHHTIATAQITRVAAGGISPAIAKPSVTTTAAMKITQAADGSRTNLPHSQVASSTTAAINKEK
jgi:hypothetical protein